MAPVSAKPSGSLAALWSHCPRLRSTEWVPLSERSPLRHEALLSQMLLARSLQVRLLLREPPALRQAARSVLAEWEMQKALRWRACQLAPTPAQSWLVGCPPSLQPVVACAARPTATARQPLRPRLALSQRLEQAAARPTRRTRLLSRFPAALQAAFRPHPQRDDAARREQALLFRRRAQPLQQRPLCDDDAGLPGRAAPSPRARAFRAPSEREYVTPGHPSATTDDCAPELPSGAAVR